MTIRAVSSPINEASVASVHVEKQEQVAGGIRFDWLMLFSCAWLLGGGYLDAWAHNHIRLETFFTPWHAVLYSGLLVVLLFHVGALVRNRLRGYSWRYAIPAGYELSLLGIVGFAFGGVGDMIWHTLFGIELNIDGALSPTHLILATCIGLIVAGPFRAAWKRPDISPSDQPSFLSLLPMILSLTLTYSAVTLIGQIAHPFVFLWPSSTRQDPFSYQALAVVSIILQAIILMGFVLITLRRWQLPFGTFTVVLTLNMFMLSFMQDHYLLIAVSAVTGLLTDVLLWWLKPSVRQPDALFLFAFMVPSFWYLVYFLTLISTTGIAWTVHLWLGSTVVAGIAGWLLSYLLVPPALPGEQKK